MPPLGELPVLNTLVELEVVLAELEVELAAPKVLERDKPFEFIQKAVRGMLLHPRIDVERLCLEITVGYGMQLL